MELKLSAVRLPSGAVLSHTSAARLWDLPLPRETDDTVHLTLPPTRSRWATTTAVVHRRRLRPEERDEVDGLPVTTPLRTVIDLSRVLELGPAVAAADHALRERLVAEEELRREALAVHGPGAVEARRMAGLIDPAAGSALESIFRVLLWGGGVPAPVSQYEVADGLFVARVDFAWPDYRLIVELDGFAYHSDRASYRNDRERGNQLERLRWRVLRFTWEDVMFRPDEVLAMVRAALAG